MLAGTAMSIRCGISAGEASQDEYCHLQRLAWVNVTNTKATPENAKACNSRRLRRSALARVNSSGERFTHIMQRLTQSAAAPGKRQPKTTETQSRRRVPRLVRRFGFHLILIERLTELTTDAAYPLLQTSRKKPIGPAAGAIILAKLP